MLNQEELKKYLAYDPNTGEFKHAVNRKRVIAGTKVGVLHHSGHINIKLFDKIYLAHRLAWLYIIGDWPKNQIDHINLIKHDNRFCNLREATFEENMRNVKVRSNNKSGFKGVCSSGSKFMATIKIDSKSKYLGTFETAKEASEAYAKAAKELFGEFARN